MKYRREIDGLRALAVLPVIFFHAGFQTFSGGFLGVDIFFVISGYLITYIILTEKRAGTFTLVDFYERRARRILPALFFVLFICLPFAWFWLLPGDMERFSQSLAAVAGFVSNIFFWQTSGYFARAAEFRPLLHTWSLAVEEQYYLLFPALLILTWRLGRRRIVFILGALAVASLAAAQSGWIADPYAKFYLLPTRVWELLIGALLAFYFSRDSVAGDSRPALGRAVKEYGGAVGLLAIVGAIFAFDRNHSSPSVYTLIPTLGTALIILCTAQDTVVGRMLGNRYLVGVGRVSYSAYLWHQPLLAFARLRGVTEPGKPLLAALAVVSLALAYFTWKYVETPFRDRQRYSRRQIFRFGATGSLFFLLFGLAFATLPLKTFWEIRNPNFVNNPRYHPADHPGAKIRNCTRSLPTIGAATCKVDGTGSRRIVVWGDSHAVRLARQIPNIKNTEIYVIALSGCPPVIGVRRNHGLSNCGDMAINEGYAEYVESLKPAAVILVGRWDLYLDDRQHPTRYLTTLDTDSPEQTPAEWKRSFTEKMRETVAFFAHDAAVFVLAQPPDYAYVGFASVERTNFTVPYEQVTASQADEANALSALAGMPRLTVLDTKKLFCSAGVCRTRSNGMLLYADDNHLSPPGLEMVWRMLIDRVVKPQATLITPQS